MFRRTSVQSLEETVRYSFLCPDPRGGDWGACRRCDPAVYALRVNDDEVLQGLRQGDEKAFVALVDTYQLAMIRVALAFVSDRSAAEDVVQETWMGVIRGIDRFEGRSSLKTWIFRILVNQARKKATRDRRTVALNDVGEELHFSRDGTWITPPSAWPEDAADRLFATDVVKKLRMSIEQLPALQRQVVTLRDVEGLSPRDVCDLLDITESNQRVLLHRARQKLRKTVELEMGRG
jgi:RNA polymerase sigma-70 factor, ECF subfamily